MNPKLKIADAGNVTVPAFLTLQQRGYTVRCERSGDGSQETCIAESPTTELLADGIVTLLGLAALAESRGPDWKASDDQNTEFLKQFGYNDVA